MPERRPSLFELIAYEDLKFLANENIPILSVAHLKSQGFDITAIGLDNPSISDEQVMKIAITEERTIITYDSDYGVTSPLKTGPF